MADVLKVLSTEQYVNTSASSVSSASLVRIVNLEASTNYLITQKTSGGDTISSFTLGKAGSDQSYVYLKKDPTDTIETTSDGVDIFAVSVGFY